MRIVVHCVVVVVLTSFAIDAAAQCQPTCTSDGAVQKPEGWDISLPFEEGETVRVLSGYGPMMGSSLHCRSTDPSCANDWYALDLILPDYPESGKGQPVLAIADGEVLDADWATAGWANYGRRVYIRHDDVGDGHTYTSMYAHLDSLSVSTGDTVRKGDQIGTLGESCQEADSCGSFSTPHVHFSIHQDANFGGSGTGGSYGGRAVIPEPFDGYTSLTQGDDLTSGNGGPDPVSTCDIVIGDTETVLEEDGPCGQVVGEPADSTIGSGGHSYTATLENPSPDYATGLIWELLFESGGSYEVRVNVPAGIDDLAGEATYKIQYAGEESTIVTIDPSAAAGTEVRLGRFDFDDSSSQWLRLGDNYDDEANQGKTFVMDSVRLIPAELCECDEEGAAESEQCDVAGSRSRTCDGCTWSEWSECPPVDDANNVSGTNGTGGDDGSTGGGDGDGGGESTDDRPDVVAGEGGCGCAAAGSGSALPLLFVLGLIGAGLRRRRHSSTTAS
jgi:MYXO-CTERM domain-containing protein